MTGLSQVPGSPEAQRQIAVIGKLIGAAWIICSIVAWVLPNGVVRPYRLGTAGGFLPLQLLTYSFLNAHLYYLVVELLWLAGVVSVAKEVLGADGFIRIYSLGTVGGGLLLYLIVPTPEGGFLGPWVGLATMLAAIAVLKPTYRTHFFGVAIARFVAPRVMVSFLGLLLLRELGDILWLAKETATFNLASYLRELHFAAGLLWKVLDAAIFVFALKSRLRLTVVLCLMVLPHALWLLWVVLFARGSAGDALVFTLAMTAGIGVGFLYGFVERWSGRGVSGARR
jgi:membrane associated rhomboid family serine protease